MDNLMRSRSQALYSVHSRDSLMGGYEKTHNMPNINSHGPPMESSWRSSGYGPKPISSLPFNAEGASANLGGEIASRDLRERDGQQGNNRRISTGSIGHYIPLHHHSSTRSSSSYPSPALQRPKSTADLTTMTPFYSDMPSKSLPSHTRSLSLTSSLRRPMSLSFYPDTDVKSLNREGLGRSRSMGNDFSISSLSPKLKNSSSSSTYIPSVTNQFEQISSNFPSGTLTATPLTSEPLVEESSDTFNPSHIKHNENFDSHISHPEFSKITKHGEEEIEKQKSNNEICSVSPLDNWMMQAKKALGNQVVFKGLVDHSPASHHERNENSEIYKNQNKDHNDPSLSLERLPYIKQKDFR